MTGLLIGPSIGIVSPQPVSGGGGPPYVANAVNFDGSADRLTRGGDLTGLSDGELATYSFWFNLGGNDGQNFAFFNNSVNRFLVGRLSTNRITARIFNAAEDKSWNIETVALYNTATNPGWHHLMVSIRADGTPIATMYIDDVAEPVTIADAIDANTSIDFTTGDFFMSNVAGWIDLTGDMADFWFDDVYLPVAVEANRRKFIDAAGKPVNLGATGQLPTGTSPKVYFSGATDDWHTNKGTGGGFTEAGALTTAATSPSD